MQRHSLIPAVYLLMIRDNKILMLRRANTGYGDGQFTLPSGHLEDGEKLNEACVREAREETGVKLKSKDVHLVHVMRRYQPGDDRVDFFYETQVWKGQIYNAEPNKCDEVIWTDMDHLPENTLPYVAEFMKLYRKSAFFSDIGDFKKP